MTRFTVEDNIFRDEDPFREDWSPNQLYEREEELDDYATALSPIIRGYSPKNIFLYGKAGVGKTVATEYILSDLEDELEDQDDVNLTVINLSCRSISSSYQAACHLTNQLRNVTGKDEIATTGHGKEEVFNHLFSELDEIGGTILLVLDEIDNINDDDILYRIPRATANDDVSEADPGIIGISNDFQFKQKLSPEVKDTLCDEELNFAPYSAEALQRILRHRANIGFYDDVLDDDVIPFASAIAGQDTGSARQALRLIYKAGEIARDKYNSDSVTEQHVTEAQEKLEKGKIKQGIRDLTTQDHIVLCAIIELTLREETPARTKDVYERYRKLVDTVEANELVQRRMYTHLDELVRYGFLSLDEQNEGYRSGRYYEYELNLSMDLVLSALMQVERIEPIADSYLSRYEKNNLQ